MTLDRDGNDRFVLIAHAAWERGLLPIPGVTRRQLVLGAAAVLALGHDTQLVPDEHINTLTARWIRQGYGDPAQMTEEARHVVAEYA